MKMHALRIMAAALALALMPASPAAAHGGGGRGGGGGWHGGGGGGGWRGGGWGGGFYGGYYNPWWGDSYYPDYDYGNPYYGATAPAYTTHASATLAVQVQEKLAGAGYYQGTVDGVIGPITRDAIARYQSDHKMAVTSSIDEPLLQSLGLI